MATWLFVDFMQYFVSFKLITTTLLYIKAKTSQKKWHKVMNSLNKISIEF